jgi:hypothetical protein
MVGDAGRVGTWSSSDGIKQNINESLDPVATAPGSDTTLRRRANISFAAARSVINAFSQLET